jgi:hypothetical protein
VSPRFFAFPALLLMAATFAPGVGIRYESFDFRSPDAVGMDRLSLLTVPLGASVRLNRALEFGVSAAWASGRLVEPDGNELTLSGPTDTEVRLVVRLGQDLVTLTGIALLPTGSESLSSEEADLAGAIAADVLPFAISNWGSGGGAGMNAAIVRPLGSFAAGLSLGYIVAREFEPLNEDAFNYRPGNQLQVRAALDRTFGRSSKAALVFTMHRFQEDEIDGSNLFRTGDRYELLGSLAFALGGTGTGIVYGGYLHRDQGDAEDSEFTVDTRVLQAQDLLFTGLGFEVRAGSVMIRPAADLRVLRRDDGFDQGYTADIGASVEFPVGQMSVAPRLRGRFGNVLLLEDVESRFIGFDLGLGLRWRGFDR